MIACGASNLTNISKATPTNFSLIFPKIPTESTISANNPFVLNIFGVIIPAVSIAEEELSWQSNKTKHSLIPTVYDPLLINYMVDSNFENWKLLYNWMNYINNNFDKIAEYHNNYSIDATLVIKDNFMSNIMELIFKSIWPSTLGEIQFSYREGDIQIESTINFTYDYFTINE